MQHKNINVVRSKKERIAFYIDSDSKNVLLKDAKSNGISISSFITQMVKRELIKREETDGIRQ